ncbi:MAG TPA: TraB/GumN family protein [Rhizomicrobium sp.]|nr:TraB/GumN family protein [Rhizomicrobium sp.]
MRSTVRRALLATALFLIPAATVAEDAPKPAAPAAAANAPVQDWSKDIETVVVTVDNRGPLIWHVQKGDSELYILGIVTPVPETLEWRTGGVEAALKGASQLLLPPQASVGLFEGVWFLMWNRDAIYLPSSTTMESTLPADLSARFTKVRDSLHRDADRYSDLRVPLAGLRLAGDFQKSAGLDYRKVSKMLDRLASRAHVKSKPIATYEALPLVKQLPKMSPAANAACMKAALDDIEVQRVHAEPAAEAWAVGDLDGIKANYSDTRFESCIQSMPSFSALFDRAVRDSTNAANAALARKGKTLMVVSMGELLRRGGLLERLRAEGVTVDPPSNQALPPA